MRLILLAFVALLSTSTLYGQFDGPRLFWDIPHFYLSAPNLGEVDEVAGVGLETSFNVAAHWGTARAGFGSTFTVNPTANDIPNSFLANPYLIVEAGGGMYRTNTNKCASSNRAAFTAMGLIGIRNDFNAPEGVDSFSWGLGVELGYFYIKNMFSNTEFVLRTTYYPGPSTVSASLGFKHFLNVREFGNY